MPKISLEAFSIRILYKPDFSPKALSGFNSRDDLFDICSMYLNQDFGRITDQNRQKAYQVEQYHQSDRSIFGTIKSGSFGMRNEIVDVDAHVVNYVKNINEAELSPFYFNINIPLHKPVGILLLQRTGAFGITSAIRKFIQNRFNNSFRNYKMDISPLLPDSVVNEILRRGRLTELKLIRYSLPSDIVDALDGSAVAEDYTIEINIKAKRRKSLHIKNKIMEVLEGKIGHSEIIQVRDLENEEVKVVAEVDGQTRTINLADFSRMRPSYNIDDSISLGDDGHPIYESIHESAQDLTASLARAVGIAD